MKSSEKRYLNPYKLFHGCMVPNWLAERPEISPGAKLCYARLTQYAGENGRAFPKQSTLGAALGVTKRQVSNYITELVQNGLVESIRGLDPNGSNNYKFLAHPWCIDHIGELARKKP